MVLENNNFVTLVEKTNIAEHESEELMKYNKEKRNEEGKKVLDDDDEKVKVKKEGKNNDANKFNNKKRNG